MTRIMCNIYFLVGLNIICLHWYRIYKRSPTAGLRWKCMAQPSGLIHTLSALTETMLLNKTHLSESHILGSEGFMKVTWMLTDTKRGDRLSEPVGQSHRRIFIRLSCQHVNPQRAINNRSCIWIFDLKLTVGVYSKRAALELLWVLLFMIICANAIKPVQNLSVSKCIQTPSVCLK